VAVTFAGLISQDQKPSPWLLLTPPQRWLLPGHLEWLGRWDGCQPHCWRTSQCLLTLPPSAGIHLLSLVPCSACQRLEAGGVFLSPICAAPSAVGFLAQMEVTWGTAVAQSCGSHRMRPRYVKQEGAFNAGRSLNYPASICCLYTIMWIFFHPERRRGFILGNGGHSKTAHCTLWERSSLTEMEPVPLAVVSLGLVCSRIWKMGINMH